MSQPHTISHFPLALPDLFASRYTHPRPPSYAGWLRSQGLHTRLTGQQVEVLHGPGEPDPARRPDARRPARPEELPRAAGSWLRSRLHAAGYLRLGDRSVAPTPLRTLRGRAGGQPVAIQEHRAWRWELLGTPPRWLVPLPTQLHLSGAPPDDPAWAAWLAARGRPISAVELRSGRSGRLERRGGRQGLRSHQRWYPLEGGDWRLILSVADRASLGCDSTPERITLTAILRALEGCEPLAGALSSLTPRGLTGPGATRITGRHIACASGRCERPAARRGLLEPPPPFELLVVAPRQPDMERLKALLNTQLVPREVLRATPRGRAALHTAGSPRASLASC